MKLLSIVFVGLFAIGCAKSNSADISSLRIDDPANPNIGASCAPMDIYNQGANTGVVADIQIAGSPMQDTFFDYVQVKLSALPPSFYEGNGVIEFYDYSVQRGIGPVTSNNRLSIDIVPIDNIGAQRRGLTQITYNDIGGFNLNDFVLVVNVGNSAQMLDLAYFDGSGTYSGSNYGLLPPYIARPELFLSEKTKTYGELAAKELWEFHPLKGVTGSTQNSFYESMANSRYCFNGIPASL